MIDKNFLGEHWQWRARTLADHQAIRQMQLHLIGTFSLSGSTGRTWTIASKKNRALLAILALSPRQRATRERVAGLLWGESGEESARNSLRQALAVLRKEFEGDGFSPIFLQDDQIILRTDMMNVDALQILAAAESNAPEVLRPASALCTGELLADVSLNEASFDDWLTGQKARLAVAAIKVLEQLAAQESGVARIDLAQRLVDLEPLREASHRQLISAFAAFGDRALALKQFEACRKLLREDLGVEPSEETQALRRQIVTGPEVGEAGASAKSAPAEPELQRPSIAVLPFANLGDDPSQTYLSDGIASDIISELSRWQLLQVQSRSASFRYRGLAVDPRQVAQDLNVRYVVEGSVRRVANRMRISVQLIDARSGNHVWAERFDHEVDDLFAVQDKVVRTIVSTLAGRVQVASAGQLSRKPPVSLLAYECVLKGNALPWNEPEAAAEATRLFARAVELDPGYGLAHSLLANMKLEIWQDSAAEDGAALEEAYRLAQRAIDLDSNDSTCFSILSAIVLHRRMFDLAVQHARRATEINPNNQWNTADLGFVLSYVGQPKAALDCFHKAREIDPYFNPSWLWSCLGQTHMLLHRPTEALAAFEHLQTRGYWVAALMAGCHARLGQKRQAAEFAAECLRLRPDFSTRRRLAREPFKLPEDTACISEALTLAGLPD